MRFADLVHLTAGAVSAQRQRSVLTGLGIAVGITAVVLLTALGEGLQRFVLAEFSQFGTNLIAVTPGKTSTLGMSGAVIGTVRPLSLEDAAALSRVSAVEAVVPVVQGNAAVETDGRSRRVMVIGVGADLPRVWRMRPVLGRFLPDDEPRRARPYAVLGAKVHAELFGQASPLGERVRVGGESYRVIGVMEPKGQMLGFDLDDTVYLPIGRAMAMFDRQGLMEIDLLYREGAEAGSVAEAIKTLLTSRHGREDFTIVTQDQMLEVLGSVMDILTAAVAALGGISLLVGGIGILTIMTIAVRERTAEIGLLRALGAGRRQVLALFLGEALVLAGLGGAAGLALATVIAWAVRLALPALPVHLDLGYALAALGVAFATGLIAGVTPALRAARLDPVTALRDE